MSEIMSEIVSSSRGPLVVHIFGNIGVGKTTLLGEIETWMRRELPDVRMRVLRERVDLWSSSGLLEAFYDDPNAFAAPFQFGCLFSRLLEAATRYEPDVDVYLSEQSVWAERAIFVAANKETIPGPAFRALSAAYDAFPLLEHPGYANARHLHLFVAVAPEVAFERVSRRARVGEGNITLEYMRDLDARARALYDDPTSMEGASRLKVYPAEIDPERDVVALTPAIREVISRAINARPR